MGSEEPNEIRIYNRRRFLGAVVGLTGSATALGLVLEWKERTAPVLHEADFYRPLRREDRDTDKT